MSINDPLVIEAYKDGYLVCRGKETWYDDERRIIVHETVDDAKAWAFANLGAIPLWEGDDIINQPPTNRDEQGRLL